MVPADDPADDPVPPGNEYQSPDGGYQTPDGGYQTPDGGYQTPYGGYQTPGDGYQSPDGGYQTPDAGYQSPDGNATDHNQSVPSPADPVYVPIVSTRSFTEDANGSHVFGGQILTDGGSPVLEAGILISRSIFFVDPIRLPAKLDPQTQEFSITHHGLESGTIHYYRAYARNAVGETQGVRRKLKTAQADDPSAWWTGMPESAGGWRTSDWFGAFRLYGNGWIYHAKLGWAHVVSDGHQGIWLWQKERGWLWTQPGVFPYLWLHEGAGWLYLLGNSDGTPVFWDYGIQAVQLDQSGQ